MYEFAFTPEEKQFLEGMIEEARRFPAHDLGQDVISIDGYCKELRTEFRRTSIFETLARQHGIGYAISFGNTKIPRKLVSIYHARLREREAVLRKNLFEDQMQEDFKEAQEYIEAEGRVLEEQLITVVLGQYYQLVTEVRKRAETSK